MKRTLELALIQGGDSRLDIMPSLHQGTNRYGCSPRPEAAHCTFSSCTASTISPLAYAAAAQEFAVLEHAPAQLLAERMDSQRGQLLQVLGLETSGANLVFAASGTDATMLALFLARGASSAPLDSVLVAPEESGRGVALAAAGRHSDERTAQDALVAVAGPVSGLADGVTLVRTAVRDDTGRAYEPEDIDQRICQTVGSAVGAGRRVLLHAMDSSKLGLRYPSPGVLEQLQDAHGHGLCILVDACQGRIADARLAWHLERGHLVSITGSKFYRGPPFSGALLVPRMFAASAENLSALPQGLTDYTSASAWPVGWRGIRAGLQGPDNLGLHLRWTAALAEMQAYAVIPAARRSACLRHLCDGISQTIAEHATLHAVPIAQPRQAKGQGSDQDGAIQTIFPLFLQRQDRPLSFEHTVRIYQELHGHGMHIGQPVRLGSAGALRICADARLVCEHLQEDALDPTLPRLRQTLRQLGAMMTQLTSGIGQD